MLKKLLFLLLIGGAGYYLLAEDTENPEVIENPLYGELRMQFEEGSREINFVLFAKMANAEDCLQRSRRVWEKAFKSCRSCTFKSTECKAELWGQYKNIFNEQPLDTTYLSAERGNRYERDGRMIVWGLNRDEADKICETMKAYLRVNYEGVVRCVGAGD